jgi:hypothetical protein
VVHKTISVAEHGVIKPEGVVFNVNVDGVGKVSASQNNLHFKETISVMKLEAEELRKRDDWNCGV